jgi:4-hydroxy-4-methyl-2-oxoglutarate aldolase
MFTGGFLAVRLNAIQESEGDHIAGGVLVDQLGIPRNDSTVQFDVPPHPYAPTPEKLDKILRRDR